MLQILLSGTLRRTAVLLLSFLASTAHASFHVYQIDQIYSDASGTVQYIRLSALLGGQQFLHTFGASITTTSPGMSTQTYPFPVDLPGDTTGKKFLIATNGFVALGTGVTPDYVVPNGFLFLPGGRVDYMIYDSIIYAALPTNGTHALDHSGNPVIAAPINFAGTTLSSPLNVPPPVQAGPMDIDQNGQVDALTDGLLLLRYMFQLRGNALIQGAVAPGAGRNTAALIEAYLAACIAGPGSVCPIP